MVTRRRRGRTLRDELLGRLAHELAVGVVMITLIPTILAAVLDAGMRADVACRPGNFVSSLEFGAVGVVVAFPLCGLLGWLFRRWRLDPSGPRTALLGAVLTTLAWVIAMVWALVRP